MTDLPYRTDEDGNVYPEPTSDPRYILKITDQMRQYGPWGIRVPSGGTIYFSTKEEAEKYMEEHPWSEQPPEPRCSMCGGIGVRDPRGGHYMHRDSRPRHIFHEAIPPITAPWSEGGYAASKGDNK